MTKQTYQQEYLNFCISGLQSYYQDNDLTIIGLNDIEGINKHPNLLKKNFLDYIGNLLKTKNFSPRIINIFSELTTVTIFFTLFFIDNSILVSNNIRCKAFPRYNGSTITNPEI